MAAHPYDLIVIGSGPAGEKAAAHAAGLGKRVALIEKDSVLGGTVANQGTLPSKTLREAAAYLVGYRQRGIHGMTLTLQDHVSAQDFLYRERLVRQLEQARIRSYLDQSKVTLYHGLASFVDGHTLRITGSAGQGREDMVCADTILIATGGRPFRPALFSQPHESVYDSQSIINMSEIPKTLMIIGAGVVGCEYACIFAAFGVHVTLIDGHSRLMPFLDTDISAELLSNMRAQGIDVRLNDEVVGYRHGPMLVTALGSGTAISCDAILIAVGRTGNTGDLNLAAAGIEANELGLLKVNEHFQTSTPHIYAAGDVIGFPALASAAREQAIEAMIHAFTPEKDLSVALPQPYGIYTIPECSMVGETEDALHRLGEPFIVGIAHYAGNARGQIIGARTGFLKLIFHRETRRLLGVHMIGEQASELVHVGLMAMQMKAGAELFLNTCFNYPTLGDLYKSATMDALSKHASAAAPSSILRPKA